MASASDDKTVRLWDVASGECTATLQVGVPANAVWRASAKDLCQAGFDVAAGTVQAGGAGGG